MSLLHSGLITRDFNINPIFQVYNLEAIGKGFTTLCVNQYKQKPPLAPYHL